MPGLSSVVAGIGVAASVAGTATAYIGQQRATEGAEKAEKTRQAAMNLDATRRRRQIVRESILARSTALANATSQGAQAGSGLQGGQAQIAGQTATNISGVNQQQQLGTQLFAANRQQSQGNSLANLGLGIKSLGGSLTNNAGTISNVGSYLFA